MKLVSISILLDEMPEIIDLAEISSDKHVKNNNINDLCNVVIKFDFYLRTKLLHNRIFK